MLALIPPALFSGLSIPATYYIWNTPGNMKYLALLGVILLLLSLVVVFLDPEYGFSTLSVVLLISGVVATSVGYWFSQTPPKKPKLKRSQSIEEWLYTPIPSEKISAKDDLIIKLRRPGLSPVERQMLVAQLEKIE